MSMANVRNLKDSLLSYLRARRGEKWTASDMARYFECDRSSTVKPLGRLIADGLVMTAKIGGKVFFWVPAGEVVKPRETYQPMKAWQMPSPMADRLREIREQRELYPSRHV